MLSLLCLLFRRARVSEFAGHRRCHLRPVDVAGKTSAHQAGVQAEDGHGNQVTKSFQIYLT
jgi:hypothetical protein